MEKRHQARPLATPIARPSGHAPVTSEPHTAKNAPVSIMPSRPMFTTPERSENNPPIEANHEGRRVAEHGRQAAPPRRPRLSRFSDARTGREVADRTSRACPRRRRSCRLRRSPRTRRADADREREEADHDRRRPGSAPRSAAKRRTRRRRRRRRRSSATPLQPRGSRFIPAGPRSPRFRFSRRNASRTMMSAPTKRTIQSLDDDRQARREIGREVRRVEVARCGSRVERSKQESGQADADGRVPAEQCNGDADEADRGRRDLRRVDTKLPSRSRRAPLRGRRTGERSPSPGSSCGRR